MRGLTRPLVGLALFIILAANLNAQEIPKQLRGKWIVKRELLTRTISCWGESEAQNLIGTEIEYTTDSFRWKDKVTVHPSVQILVVNAEEFHDKYSGRGVNDSGVDFRQLGIKAPQVTRITLGHQPADITGDTIEIPGDVVLIKEPNTIVFSICNVYFEAQRRLIPRTNRK